MSTKIYNGYKILITRLEKIHHKMMGFQKVALGFAQDFMNAKLANYAINIWNLQFADKPSKKYIENYTQKPLVPLNAASRMMLQMRIEQKAKPHLRHELDTETKLVVFPARGKKYCLAMLFCEFKDIREAFEKLPFVEPYPYWNNSDQPDGMTWKEWEKRGKEWDKTIGKSGIPALSGAVLTILLQDCTRWVATYEAIRPFIPPKSARVNSLAIQIAQNECIQDKTYQKKCWGEFFQIIREYMESDKGKKRLKQIKKELNRRMPPLTKKQLLTPVKVWIAKSECEKYGL